MDRILAAVRQFEGVLEVAPGEGSGFPEIAWGDHFFYYAPDGRIPQRVQPYATIVTKDYPDDTSSDLNPAGRWRLNIHVGRVEFTRLIGADPRNAAIPDDAGAGDVVLPHPVYARQGFVAIVNPGDRTTTTAIELLRDAHAAARRRATRDFGSAQ